MSTKDVLSFIKGFMNGAGLKDLYDCVEKGLEEKIYMEWYYEVLDLVSKIKNLNVRDWKQIKDLFSEVIETIQSIHKEAIECFTGSEALISLIKELVSLDLKTLIPRIIKEIIANKGKLFDDLMGIIKSVKKGDFYQAGFDIADFINNMLFKMFSLSINPATESYYILKGILLGLKQDEVEVDDLLECVGDVQYILTNITDGIKDLKVIIADIKKFNFEHLFEIIQCFEKIFYDIRNIFLDMEPCAKGNKDIMKIIAIFKGKSAKEIAEHIAINCVKNAFGVFSDVKDAINYFETQRYQDFGLKIGDILYKVFLQ